MNGRRRVSCHFAWLASVTPPAGLAGNVPQACQRLDERPPRLDQVGLDAGLADVVRDERHLGAAGDDLQDLGEPAVEDAKLEVRAECRQQLQPLLEVGPPPGASSA